MALPLEMLSAAAADDAIAPAAAEAEVSGMLAAAVASAGAGGVSCFWHAASARAARAMHAAVHGAETA